MVFKVFMMLEHLYCFLDDKTRKVSIFTLILASEFLYFSEFLVRIIT